MNVNLLVVIVIIVSLIVGAFLGTFFSKVKKGREDKKIMDDATDVLAGKKKNTIKIDGQEYDAYIFKTRNEDGSETITELQGGIQTKNGKKDIKEESREGGVEIGIVDEDSISPGEGERTSRNPKRNFRGLIGKLRQLRRRSS